MNSPGTDRRLACCRVRPAIPAPSGSAPGHPGSQWTAFRFHWNGPKTVLPSKAMAKISMRLVPDQEPDQVMEQLRQYLIAKAPPTVHWEILKHSGGDPEHQRYSPPGGNSHGKSPRNCVGYSSGVSPRRRQRAGGGEIPKGTGYRIGVYRALGCPMITCMRRTRSCTCPLFTAASMLIVLFLLNLIRMLTLTER